MRKINHLILYLSILASNFACQENGFPADKHTEKAIFSEEEHGIIIEDAAEYVQLVSPPLTYEQAVNKGKNYLEKLSHRSEGSLNKRDRDFNYIKDNYLIVSGLKSFVDHEIHALPKPQSLDKDTNYPKEWYLESEDLITIGFIFNDHKNIKPPFYSKKFESIFKNLVGSNYQFTEFRNVYIFRINLKEGIIISDHIFRGINPDAPATSSFMAYAFEEARKIKKKPNAVIKELISFNIDNIDTKNIIKRVCDQESTSLEASFSLVLEVNGIEKNRKIAQALLATPNLKSAVWLAHDFPELVENKKPQWIEVSNLLRNGYWDGILASSVTF